ncbi:MULTISPECIES: LD-carboxypeptidase [Clostridium]|uniref:LD-carboxypeptidase n=1 Tax=Clostridium TaxID=1485 RepID=UPI00062E6F33|nr:LD-carboxypeptidase [Clostridium sp. C8]KLE15152.1 peptidase S66 [Clostridium sp. C8]
MKSILKINDTIALIACSNGLDKNTTTKINELINILNSLNLNVVLSNSLYKDENNNSYSYEIRAKELMNFYKDNTINAIFDLSGGDLCNEILDFLDYEFISTCNKPFFGYSDLSVILNALLTKSNTINYNYQLRNLIREDSENQIINFKNSVLEGTNDLFNFSYKWLQGKSMMGEVVGGNIRCFLKLAGTKFIPSFNGKILFLEALSGDINKISTFLTQYKQIGAFTNINGILLGSFTELEKDFSEEEVINLLLRKINNPDLPIAKTNELGHGSNSKCIAIGKTLFLN